MSDESVRLICGTVFYVTTIFCVGWVAHCAFKFLANLGKHNDE